jgi:hypothetical protein
VVHALVEQYWLKLRSHVGRLVAVRQLPDWLKLRSRVGQLVAVRQLPDWSAAVT